MTTELPFEDSQPAVLQLRFRPRRDQPGCANLPDLPNVTLPDDDRLREALKAHVERYSSLPEPVKVAVNGRQYRGPDFRLVAYVETGPFGNINAWLVETVPRRKRASHAD